MIYPIAPVAKPRMTRRDKWKKRPAVEKYMAFKDACRVLGVELRDAGDDVTFMVPMPASWGKKKRKAMDMQPHQQRPDVDNFMKALMDATKKEDSGVWDVRIRKVWTAGPGAIQIVR